LKILLYNENNNKLLVKISSILVSTVIFLNLNTTKYNRVNSDNNIIDDIITHDLSKSTLIDVILIDTAIWVIVMLTNRTFRSI